MEKAKLPLSPRIRIALETLGKDAGRFLVFLLLQQRIADDGIGAFLAVVTSLIVVFKLHVEKLASEVFGLDEVLLIVIKLGQQHTKGRLLLRVVRRGNEFLVVASRFFLPPQADHARPQRAEGTVLYLGRGIAFEQGFHIIQRRLIAYAGPWPCRRRRLAV